MDDVERAALLGQLLNQPPVEPPAASSRPVAPAATPAPATSSPRRRAAPAVSGFYDKVQRSIALVFAMFVAGALWLAGAYFTLEALAAVGVKLAAVGWWQWAIPVAITATELGMWPRKASGRLQFFFFAAVVLFDVGTSYAGLVAWGAGRTLPIFQDLTLPAGGPVLGGLAVAVALVLAFIPERLARWAGPDLWALWS